MTCPCEKNNCAGKLPANVIQLVKEAGPVLFHRVDRPASLGDDIVTPPEELDYTNVLLVYEANNHAYLYSSDGIPTFISMGEVDIDNLIDMIHELQQALQNEAAIRAAADEILQSDLTDEAALRATTDAKLQSSISDITSSLGEINEKADSNAASIGQLQSAVEDNTLDLAGLRVTVTAHSTTNVVKDFSVSSDASTVNISKERGKLDAPDAPGVDVPLPVASSEQAGIMNASTYNALQQNSENIDSILGGAVAVENIRSDVTQAQLTVVWKQNTGKTELVNRASIYDISNNRVWYYYENRGEWLDMPAGDTSVTVSQATNESLGIVKGSEEDGQIAVEADGSMSLNGWDGVQHDLDNLTDLLNGINVPTLPPYFPGKGSGTNILSGWNYSATSASPQMTIFNSNANTYSPVLQASLSGAGPTTAGLMVAADKVKLNSLLNITALGDGLSLSEDGVLSATGGGGDAQLAPSEVTKVQNLGVGSLTNMVGVTQFTNKVEIEFERQNLVAGGAALQTALIDEASEEAAGVMSSADKVKLDNITPLTEMEQTRVSNLPAAVVTGFEDTTYATDSLVMHLDTKDLATGGVSVQELTLSGATSTAAGVMTATQASQLASLVEGGGGSAVNLLTAYTDEPSTEDVYAASYVNSRLNGSRIAIGRLASTTGSATGSMAIGMGAEAGSVNYSAMAIGSGAICQNEGSVALGGGSETSRSGEVSIGFPSATIDILKYRYLANVRAGVLDTDAVNVAQLNAAVGNINSALATLISGTGAN